MNLELTDDIFSVSHVSEMIFEIDRLLGRMQDNVVQQQVAKLNPDAVSASVRLQNLATHNGTDARVSSGLEELLEGLKVLRDKAPQVKLTVAGWPDTVVQARLVEWFRRQISPNVLIKFVVRSDICGGVIVQTENRRLDLSYRELLIGNRNRIAELAYHAG